MKRTSIFGFALLLAFVATVPALAVEVTVSIENLAPRNVNFLTPVWVGFHDGSFDSYDVGVAATPGLERIAEDDTVCHSIPDTTKASNSKTVRAECDLILELPPIGRSYSYSLTGLVAGEPICAG